MTETRSKATTPRYTPTEWAEMEVAAKSAGQTVHEFVRAAPLAAARREQRTITVDGKHYGASDAETLAWALTVEGHPATARNGRVFLQTSATSTDEEAT
jgi:hypothetical protein